MSSPVVRAAQAEDAPLLRRMLAHAAAWRESGPVDVAIDSEPLLAAYVEDWPRPGDVGVVAEAEGQAVGAAWFRLFTPARCTYGFIAPEIPELAIGVDAAWRGRGIGTALLTELVARARASGLPALSLNVELGNPALHLYERAGFAPAEVRPDAMTMRLDL